MFTFQEKLKNITDKNIETYDDDDVYNYINLKNEVY